MWKATVACGVWFASALEASAEQPTMSFSVLSDPIDLAFGETYNTAQTDGGYKAHLLPKEVIDRYASGEKNMAITNFTMDMVRIGEDGKETSVGLNDHYLHHYILNFGQGDALEELLEMAEKDKHVKMMLTGCHGMQGKGVMMFQELLAKAGRDPHIVSFGSAAGAEYRYNPQGFHDPFAIILKKPQAFLPTYHIINTKDDNHTVSRLLECPCTPQRKIDPVAGTIDGKEPYPPFGCSDRFAATGNRACSLSTYVGGWRCCEHGMFVIDTDKYCKDPACSEKPKDRVYMKFKFEYKDAVPETRDIEPAACCDTTSDWDHKFGNVEHDVPVCKDNEECTYVTENVQPLGHYWNWPFSPKNGSDLVDLVFAAPHVHWAGISIELMDGMTNKTICKVEHKKDNSGGIMYGHGKEPGNEKGYLVGLETCRWTKETAPRFRRDHPIRTRSVYDASTYHMGVMSLWLVSLSPVPRGEQQAVVNDDFLV